MLNGIQFFFSFTLYSFSNKSVKYYCSKCFPQLDQIEDYSYKSMKKCSHCKFFSLFNTFHFNYNLVKRTNEEEEEEIRLIDHRKDHSIVYLID